jgi:hypothetical protein
MGDLHFIVADEPWRERLGREWGPVEEYFVALVP